MRKHLVRGDKSSKFACKGTPKHIKISFATPIHLVQREHLMLVKDFLQAAW